MLTKACVKECIKIISSSLRIPLLHFYPHKINAILYLWGSLSPYPRAYAFFGRSYFSLNYLLFPTKLVIRKHFPTKLVIRKHFPTKLVIRKHFGSVKSILLSCFFLTGISWKTKIFFRWKIELVNFEVNASK